MPAVRATAVAASTLSKAPLLKRWSDETSTRYEDRVLIGADLGPVGPQDAAVRRYARGSLVSHIAPPLERPGFDTRVDPRDRVS